MLQNQSFIAGGIFSPRSVGPCPNGLLTSNLKATEALSFIKHNHYKHGRVDCSDHNGCFQCF